VSAGGASFAGSELVSGAVRATTSNAMICPVVPASEAPPTVTDPPYGESGPTFMRMSRVPGANVEKSTTTSYRSPGAMGSWSSFAGAPVMNPPSVPMTFSFTGAAFIDCVPNLTMSQRESEPLRRRNRYLRASTSSFGQTLPFTTIVLPKNSEL
jgi:hypothetical protein